jgi:hypothetical protein
VLVLARQTPAWGLDNYIDSAGFRSDSSRLWMDGSTTLTG